MTLLLIDANGLAHRAFHATASNRSYREDGLPNFAIGRFLDLIDRLLIDVGRPQCVTHAAAIFDPKGKNWRHSIAPTYKAGRKHDPDLAPQLRLCRDLVGGLGIASVVQPGYEADDLIATYARLAEAEAMGVVIVSADKDLLQLLRPGVAIFNPMTRTMVDEWAVIERFGVAPHQIPCFQGLVGDTTDGYAGIPGVGPAAAAELLCGDPPVGGFGDLESLLAGATAIQKPALRAKVMAGAELARQCRRLALLDDAVPVRRSLDDLALTSPDADLIIGGLKALGLIHWPGAFGERWGIDPRTVAHHPAIINLADELVELAAA